MCKGRCCFPLSGRSYSWCKCPFSHLTGWCYCSCHCHCRKPTWSALRWESSHHTVPAENEISTEKELKAFLCSKTCRTGKRKVPKWDTVFSPTLSICTVIKLCFHLRATLNIQVTCNRILHSLLRSHSPQQKDCTIGKQNIYIIVSDKDTNTG